MILSYSKIKLVRTPQLLVLLLSSLIFSGIPDLASAAQNETLLKTQPKVQEIKTKYQDTFQDKINPLKWKFQIVTENHESELENKLSVLTQIDLHYKKFFNSYIGINVNPLLSFESAKNSTYKSEKPSNSQLDLASAYLLLDSEWLDGQLGIQQINNEFSSHFYNSKSLIGLHLKLNLDTFVIQQNISSIPSSVNTLKTSESNNTVSLSLTQLKWNTQLEKIKAEIMAGYFKFQDLNSAIATDSVETGNSINLINNIENNFLYKYSGPMTEIKIQAELHPIWSASLKYSALRNVNAPVDSNFGETISLGNSLILWDDKYTLENNFFRNEPDSTVSALSNRIYFQNNKIGYNHGLWFEPNRQNLKIGLGGGVNQLLYQNSLQSEETFYWISLETFYANL
jgi:hypothetical protein